MAPALSPNSTATFSPPPPLTSGESSATPGKSNLKQSSQFERKREGSPAKTTADEETNLLPEIPTIEVLSGGTEEEGGEGSKVGKTPVKGVRFADEVDEEEEEEESEVGGGKNEKQSTETNDTTLPAVSELSTSAKKTAEEEDKDREEMMESVDFDKVTGTSTPIIEVSPALAKRGLTPDSQALTSSADSSSAVEEREEVIVATMDGEREHQSREKTISESGESETSTAAEECSKL